MSGFLPVGQNALTSASFVIMKTRKCNLTYKRFKEGPVALFVNSPSRVTRNTDDKGHKMSFFLYSFILTLQISRTKMLNLRQKKTRCSALCQQILDKNISTRGSTIIKFRSFFKSSLYQVRNSWPEEKWSGFGKPLKRIWPIGRRMVLDASVKKKVKLVLENRLSSKHFKSDFK